MWFAASTQLSQSLDIEYCSKLTSSISPDSAGLLAGGPAPGRIDRAGEPEKRAERSPKSRSEPPHAVVKQVLKGKCCISGFGRFRHEVPPAAAVPEASI